MWRASIPTSLLRFLEPLSDADQQRWALLNTALFVDGLYLKITEPVPTPLVILHVATADGAGNIAYPRVIIEAAPGSSATIIEHHVAQGEHTPLSNSNTHIALRHGFAARTLPRVRHGRRRHAHRFARRSARTKDSQCKQFTIVLGGGLVRTTLEAHLDKPGASLDSYSLLVGHEERHVDCVNIVTHAAPDTRSHQTARAIASDTSRVIFNSKVIVNAGAVHARLAAILPRPAALARPPKSTRGRSSKFMPMRSSARTAQPPAGSTPTCCSTCCRAASTATRRRACWCMRFSPMC